MSNMDLTGKFALVLTLLLFKRTWSAWRNPNNLAFLQTSAIMTRNAKIIGSGEKKELFEARLTGNVLAIEGWNFLSSALGFDDENTLITLLTGESMTYLFWEIFKFCR